MSLPLHRFQGVGSGDGPGHKRTALRLSELMLTLVITAAAGAFPARAEGAPGSSAPIITGVVVSQSDGRPIGGASVSLTRGSDPEPVFETQSLVNGSFILRAEPGSYRLRASARAYAHYETRLHISAAGGAQVVVRMSLRPAIRLKVLRADGQPVRTGELDAAVRVRAAADKIEGTASGDAAAGNTLDVTFDGSISKKSVREVTIFARDPLEGCAEVDLDSWPEQPVTVRLGPGFSLAGTVFDAANKPLAGVPVIALRVMGLAPDFDQHAVTMTDARGTFLLPALPDSIYAVLARGPAAQSRLKLILLSESQAGLELVADQKMGADQKPAP